MPRVPLGRRCESDEGSTDILGDGRAGEASNSPDGALAGIGEPSDSAGIIPSECGGRCESDEGSADDLEDGRAGEASNSTDGALADVGEPSDSGIPSECDGDDDLVRKDLL